MSDLDDYTALFDRTGVAYQREEWDTEGAKMGVSPAQRLEQIGLVVPSGTNPMTAKESTPEGSKNAGYTNFYVGITFTATGELLAFGAWEGSW